MGRLWRWFFGSQHMHTQNGDRRLRSALGWCRTLALDRNGRRRRALAALGRLALGPLPLPFDHLALARGTLDCHLTCGLQNTLACGRALAFGRRHTLALLRSLPCEPEHCVQPPRGW